MYTGISLSARPCVRLAVCVPIRVSICVQNISVCQSTGRGIKSHLVTALEPLFLKQKDLCRKQNILITRLQQVHIKAVKCVQIQSLQDFFGFLRI